MAGAVVVCLGIAVLVVALLALREPRGHVSAGGGASSVAKQSSSPSAGTSSRRSTAASSAHASTSRTADAKSSSAVKSVPLVVLNNTTVQGLAASAAQRFESGGWTVTRYDNYQNDIVSTCAYYDPSITGAQAAAEALQAQYPTIKRVRPRFAGLPTGPVVVVLTPDYSAG